MTVSRAEDNNPVDCWGRCATYFLTFLPEPIRCYSKLYSQFLSSARASIVLCNLDQVYSPPLLPSIDLANPCSTSDGATYSGTRLLVRFSVMSDIEIC